MLSVKFTEKDCEYLNTYDAFSADWYEELASKCSCAPRELRTLGLFDLIDRLDEEKDFLVVLQFNSLPVRPWFEPEGGYASVGTTKTTVDSPAATKEEAKEKEAPKAKEERQ